MNWLLTTVGESDGSVLFGPVWFSSESEAYNELWRHVKKKEYKSIHKGAPDHHQTLQLTLSDDFGNTAIRLELRGIQQSGGDMAWYERFEEERPARFRIFPEFGGTWMWSEYGVGTCPDAYFENVPGIRQLEEEFDRWQDEYEDAIEPAVINATFDWESYHSRGIELCRRFKSLVGNDATIFYVKAYEDPNSDQHETRIIVA